MLTLSQASSIVDHALAYARAHDLAPMTISALDARGCLVALKMEDGCGLMRPEIAAGKAWGALGMGFGTRNLAGRAQSLPQFLGPSPTSRMAGCCPSPAASWSATRSDG
jgi:uncharacterized protein GlcG (DUF336 family)